MDIVYRLKATLCKQYMMNSETIEGAIDIEIISEYIVIDYSLI